MTRIPTRKDYEIFDNDKTITAILVTGIYSGDTVISGNCFSDRKKRFEDGYPITTSIIKSYSPGRRILKTKNSIYLLTEGEVKAAMTIKHQVSEMLLEKGALKEVIEAIDEHVVQLLEKYSDDQVPFPLLILHMNIRQILSSA